VSIAFWDGLRHLRQNPDGAVRYGTFSLLGQQLVQCPEALEMTPGAPYSCLWTDVKDRPTEGCGNLSFRQSVPPKGGPGDPMPAVFTCLVA